MPAVLTLMWMVGIMVVVEVASERKWAVEEVM